MSATFARIAAGTVQEIITVPDGMQLDQMFTPGIVAQCVTCDGTVRQGYSYDGSAFHAPAPPPKTLDPVDRTFGGGFTWS